MIGWRTAEYTSDNSRHAHKAILHDILLDPFFLRWIIHLHYIQRLLCYTNATHRHQLAASCHNTGTGSLCWHISQSVPAISAQAEGLEAIKRCSWWVTTTDHIQLSIRDDRRRIDSFCRHWLQWLPNWLNAVSGCHLTSLQSITCNISIRKCSDLVMWHNTGDFRDTPLRQYLSYFWENKMQHNTKTRNKKSISKPRLTHITHAPLHTRTPWRYTNYYIMLHCLWNQRQPHSTSDTSLSISVFPLLVFHLLFHYLVIPNSLSFTPGLKPIFFKSFPP